jgi:hypothetical protein
MLSGAVSVGCRTLVTFALAALPVLAQAQEVAPPDPLDAYAQAMEEAPADQPAPNPVPPPDESAVLGQALTIDSASLAASAPARPLRLHRLSDTRSLAVTRADQPDGSGIVTVKQPLSSEWDANVGADLGVASQGYKPLPVPDRSSGAAWASVGLPNLASVDARVDPANDQGQVGTTFKRSIPMGRHLAVTLQDSYSVTQTYATPVNTGPSDIPVMAVPQDTGAPASSVYGNARSVSFDVLPTGTTLAAGLSSSSIDPVTHNTLSASQKLLGPLQVTTAVTDVGQPGVSKSISAGLKLNW